MKNRALFLDRDGVINRLITRNGRIISPSKLQDIKIFPCVKPALNRAKNLELTVIVFTNQPDIARGLADRKKIEKIHDYLTDKLPIDDIFMCPHDDADGCSCRKPKPGMLIKAARKWNIDLKKSFVVGDRWKDTEAGKNAGCKTFFIASRLYPDNRDAKSDFKVKNLLEAIKIIENF